MIAQDDLLSRPKKELSCWIVTSGVVGMENQCLGLAQAMGVTPVVKRVRLRSPWKQLAPFLRCGLARAFSDKGDSITPPWPDLLIGCGRAGAAACLLARRQSGKKGGRKTFTVYIQNPVIDPSRFDLVAVPRHDQVLGANVITTRGSLHRVTPDLLHQEAGRFKEQFAHLPSPHIVVLIGGTNSVYQFTPDEMEPLAHRLAELAKETGGSILATTSRRTGEESLSLLKNALTNVPHFIWDWKSQGENPYYAMLAVADTILVTADSVNMASEACSTGKPVYVIPLSGGSEKFRLFHQTLRDDGLTRPFFGKVESWSVAPLNDVQLVANRVREMMGLAEEEA